MTNEGRVFVDAHFNSSVLLSQSTEYFCHSYPNPSHSIHPELNPPVHTFSLSVSASHHLEVPMPHKPPRDAVNANPAPAHIAHVTYSPGFNSNCTKDNRPAAHSPASCMRTEGPMSSDRRCEQAYVRALRTPSKTSVSLRPSGQKYPVSTRGAVTPG